ncbi:hypothetical protein ACIQV3_38705 [Streptomyces sp. NPDC099050]|uniref:hypothetical protein n=1 Tax=Streptomyces sp. NPDC099050 TaxID=3366100 RepID=UPI00382169DD
MKKNTATEQALPAHSAPHPPAASAAAAPDRVAAAPGDPRTVFHFAVPTEGRAYDPENYAAVR